MLSIFFLFFAIFSVVEAQNCRVPWNGFRACMKARYNENSQQKRLDDKARTNLENKIRTCYKSQKCFDPFPGVPTVNARRDCHRQVRESLRKQLGECVKQNFSDYDLIEEDELVYAWAQDEMYVNAIELDSKACPPNVGRPSVHDCARAAISASFSNNPQKSVCDSRWDCIRAQNMERGCYDRWQLAADLLCSCGGKAPYAELKEQYVKCMTQRNFAQAASDSTDYNSRWLDNAISRYCGTKLDAPCGGFGGTSGVDAMRVIASFLPTKNVGGVEPNAILTGISNGNLSGLTNLLTSVAGVGKASSASGSSSSSSSSSGSSAASSAVSNILNLLGGKGSGFGSLLGGQGLSYDFLNGQ